MSPAPRSVAVFGSSTTLDSFSSDLGPGHERWYQVVARGDGAALVAVMDGRPGQGLDLLGQLAAAPPDLLVLDLVHETGSDAVDRFAAFLTEHCPRTQVVVHQGSRVEPDDHVVGPPGWHVIDLRDEDPEGSSLLDDDPLAYYDRFLAELHAIDLRSRLAPELAEKVAVIASAGRERNRNQARFVWSAHQEQADRIVALERRTLTSAVLSLVRRSRR